MSGVAAITGLGLVTPLGASVGETWAALLEGNAIRDHARLNVEGGVGLPRVTAGGIRAAVEAVGQAGWEKQSIASDEVAVIVGTSKGPICGPGARVCIPDGIEGGGGAGVSTLNEPPSTSDNVRAAAGEGNWGLAEMGHEICQRLRYGNGRRLTISAACASGLHALIRGAMMIAGGEVRRVLVVAAEASVHPLFVGSFRRLGVLPNEGELCRPFDRDRNGFLMSEAAAAVCLERLDLNSRPLACVERFAMGGDASHLTRGDADGKVLRHLLTKVVDGRAVDLIHAHGTGTALNDPMELAALDWMLRDVSFASLPILYSHKGALGHSLGATGLVSVVLNCLCHAGGRVPGNINTRQPLLAQRVTISDQPVMRRIRRSIACASGFGGPMAVISLSS